MSKLPHAPLVEVIFDMRWDSSLEKDLEKFQFTLGTMFSSLKDDFPIIKKLQPAQLPIGALLNAPSHRFLPNIETSYPVYQIGPGVLSVNTVDKYYEWDDFSKIACKVANTFINLYKFDNDKKLTLSLKYLDFYDVNFNEINIYKYLMANFHVDIKSPNIDETENPTVLNFATAFKTNFGMMNLKINTGIINDIKFKKTGLIIDNTINLSIRAGDWDKIIPNWLNESHNYLSDYFKKMTDGKKYESFK